MSSSNQAHVGSERNRNANQQGSDDVAGSPTVRRKRLSRRLRELREERGLTSEEVTKRAGFSRGKLTRMERDEWTRPNPADIEKLLTIYKVTDPDEREALLTLARQARQRGWWVSYSDALGRGAYVGLETEATRIRTVELMLVPGLLQTEDYIRAVLRGDDVTDPDEVDRRVEARLLRQQILTRADAPTLHAVIDESVLRKITPELRGQLQRLLDLQEPHRLQVVPDRIGPHAAMTGAFTILEFTEDPTVVYVETTDTSLLLEEPAEIRQHEDRFDRLCAVALSPAESRGFIQHLLDSM
ncbi:MAG TPA: helix-turn-helix transcriptional regulator [Thermobifida alba]|nr:helix-turn-helix transcriptional regulator [Thermobifida alba]